ncbi:MAG: recombinase family protein [Actinomycetota bacterium]|jgi:hypothetical protein|nr:recombinase family protein [Actinomycetota bacterium]
MKIGYARVSRKEQKLEPQRDALLADGCERVFEEKISSREAERRALREAFDWCREGDVLVVARLDRLGRSLRELICRKRRAWARSPDGGSSLRGLRRRSPAWCPVLDSGEEGHAAPNDAGVEGRRVPGDPLHEHPEGLRLVHSRPSWSVPARAAVTKVATSCSRGRRARSRERF